MMAQTWRGMAGSVAALVLVSLMAVPAAQAQADSNPGRTWGFVTARYSTGTSGFVFGGYGYGPAFAMIGMVNNPHSGYTEFLGGAGARFALGHHTSHAVALAASRATEAWYAQLYYLPTITIGRTSTEATIQLYVPAESAGDLQFAVNPLSFLVDVGRRVAIGGTYQLSMQEGLETGHAAGMAVRVTIPAGAITLDLLRGLSAFDDEVRLSFRAFY